MLQHYGSTGSTSGNEKESKHENEEISDFRRSFPQFFVVGVKNLILLGWGLILGYPTVLVPGLQLDEHDNSTQVAFTTEEISWIASINMLCVPIGSFTSGLLMDPLGKRRLMQILNLPMLAAWALFYFSSDISHVYIGLCLAGMSGGLLEAPLLVYIAEVVEPRWRGMLTASGTATVLGGVFLQFIIGSLFHWRTVAIFSAIVPFLAFNAVFLVPESPYWLYEKNRVEDARKSLQWLRGRVRFGNVEREFYRISGYVEELKAEKEGQSLGTKKFSNHFAQFTKCRFLAPFLLIMFGFTTGHFSGMTPLQTFAVQILGWYHVPINEYYATIMLGAVQVLGCILGMIFVRSLGKRRLVFISMLGCGICFFAVATRFHMSGNQIESLESGSPNELQLSFEDFEHKFLSVAFGFRDTIDEAALKKYGTKVVAIEDENELGNFANHFSPLMTDEENSFADNLVIRYLNGLLVEPKVFENMTINRIINKTMTNLKTCKEFDSREFVELMNITKAIVVVLNDAAEEVILTLTEKVNEDAQEFTESNNVSRLIEDLNNMSEILSSLTIYSTTSPISMPICNQDKVEGKKSWLTLILLLGGSLFAHMGVKVFPWMLIGEVFPMEIRNVAAGISSALGYLIGFLSNKLFLTMVSVFTLNGTFWFFSTVAALGCIVLYFVLPETENKTLEEIEVYFDKSKQHCREEMRHDKESTEDTYLLAQQ